MSDQPTTSHRGPRWPTRFEFIQWGLWPCDGDGCTVLVNAQLLTDGYCTACEAKCQGRRYVA
jgi:hypothetical protein